MTRSPRANPRSRPHSADVTLPAAEESDVKLLTTVGNPEIPDRAIWHTLLTATAHRAATVDEARQ